MFFIYVSSFNKQAEYFTARTYTIYGQSTTVEYYDQEFSHGSDVGN